MEESNETPQRDPTLSSLGNDSLDRRVQRRFEQWPCSACSNLRFISQSTSFVAERKHQHGHYRDGEQ
jgi:hypothetical protein